MNYLEQLDFLIKELKDLDSYPKKLQVPTIRDFMRQIGDLFLNYFQNHLSEANTCGLKNKEILEKAYPAFQSYLYVLESTAETLTDLVYEQWGLSCDHRTNVEAFNKMFGKAITPLNTEEIDDTMKNLKKDFSVCKDRIPPNAPKSHWWWFED